MVDPTQRGPEPARRAERVPKDDRAAEPIVGLERSRARLDKFLEIARRSSGAQDEKLKGSVLEELMLTDPVRALGELRKLFDREGPGGVPESHLKMVFRLLDGSVDNAAARLVRDSVLAGDDPLLKHHALKGELRRDHAAGIDAAVAMFERPLTRALAIQALCEACAACRELLPALHRCAPRLYEAVVQSEKDHGYSPFGQTALEMLGRYASPGFMAAHLARTERDDAHNWRLAESLWRHFEEGQFARPDLPPGAETGLLRYYAEHPGRINEEQLSSMVGGVVLRLRNFERGEVPFEHAEYIAHLLSDPEGRKWSIPNEGRDGGLQTRGGRWKSVGEVLDEFTLSRRDVESLVDALAKAGVRDPMGELRCGAFEELSPAVLREVSEWVRANDVASMSAAGACASLALHLNSVGLEDRARRADEMVSGPLKIVCWALTQGSKSFEEAHATSLDLYGDARVFHYPHLAAGASDIISAVLSVRGESPRDALDAVMRSEAGRTTPPAWLALAAGGHGFYSHLVSENAAVVAEIVEKRAVESVVRHLDEWGETNDEFRLDPLLNAPRSIHELIGTHAYTLSEIVTHLSRFAPERAADLMERMLECKVMGEYVLSRGDHAGNAIETAYNLMRYAPREPGWLVHGDSEDPARPQRVHHERSIIGRWAFMPDASEPSDAGVRDALRYLHRAAMGHGPTPFMVSTEGTEQARQLLEVGLGDETLPLAERITARKLLSALPAILEFQADRCTREELMSRLEGEHVARKLDVADPMPRSLSQGMERIILSAEAHANRLGQTRVPRDPSVADGHAHVLETWNAFVGEVLKPLLVATLRPPASFDSAPDSEAGLAARLQSSMRGAAETSHESGRLHLPGAPLFAPSQAHLGTLSRALTGDSAYLIKDICVDMDPRFFAHVAATGPEFQSFFEAIRSISAAPGMETVTVAQHGVAFGAKLWSPSNALLDTTSVRTNFEPSTLTIDDDGGTRIRGTRRLLPTEHQSVEATYALAEPHPEPGSQSISEVRDAVSEFARAHVLSDMQPGADGLHPVVDALVQPFTRPEDLPSDLRELVEEAKRLPAAEAVRMLREYVQQNFSYDVDFATHPGFQDLLSRIARNETEPGRNEYLDLLYRERCGVCGQLATVLVDLLRHAGIPAAWTSGVNPEGTEVTELDAHAWAGVILLDESSKPIMVPVEAVAVTPDVEAEIRRRTARGDSELASGGAASSDTVRWAERMRSSDARLEFERWRSGLSTVGPEARTAVPTTSRMDAHVWEGIQQELGLSGLTRDDGLRICRLAQAALDVTNGNASGFTAAYQATAGLEAWWRIEDAGKALGRPAVREALVRGIAELGLGTVADVRGLSRIVNLGEEVWQRFCASIDELGPSFIEEFFESLKPPQS